MRKTKIICTIGPASEDEEILEKMVKAGMNVARLNFSHGTHEEHQKKIITIKKLRERMGVPIAIMLDTKGPEYRIGTFADHKIELKEGDTFIFTAREVEGDQEKVSVSYKDLPHSVEPGDKILVNNGLVVCIVKEIQQEDVICTVETGGVISDHKSMNFPGKLMQGDFLSEQDKSDLLFGIENGIDFVAASFVSTGDDMREMREFLDKNGGKDISIIAKIENRSGVENIEDICEVASGVMVARGDLGVEIDYMEVPAVQKEIVSKCRLLGRRVIIATEMLESMITNVRPTRAEISDVANAVYDGASAIMLSGKSAAGKYPVEAVSVMARVAEYTENHIHYRERFKKEEIQFRDDLDAISHTTCQMAMDLDAKCIVVSSVSGRTARMVSRFRCEIPIIGMTTSLRAYYKLALSWGVTPMLCEQYDSLDVMLYHAVSVATEYLGLKEGDRIVLTGGQIGGGAGSTNMIKVEKVHRRPAL